MEDFLKYSLEKKKRLLKTCNDFLRRIESSEREYEEATIDIDDPRYSVHDSRYAEFEHHYSLIFYDLLNWLREDWLWLPYPWDKEFIRDVEFEDRWLDDSNTWQTNYIRASGEYSDFCNLTYFFSEFLEDPNNYHWYGNEYPSSGDVLIHIGITEEFLKKLNVWIKHHRNERMRDIIRKFYTSSSHPNQKLTSEYKKLEKVVKKRLNIGINLSQFERDYVLGNTVLLKKSLDLLLHKSVQKIFLEKNCNLSNNRYEMNYYIKHLHETDPISTGTLNQIFDFEMIAEFYKIELSDSGEISVSEHQRKMELYDWYYREEDKLKKMTQYVKTSFKQFWK